LGDENIVVNRSMARSGRSILWRLALQSHEWQLGRSLICQGKEERKSIQLLCNKTYVSAPRGEKSMASWPIISFQGLYRSRSPLFHWGDECDRRRPLFSSHFSMGLSHTRTMSSRKGGAVKRLSRATQRVTRPKVTPTVPRVVEPQQTLPSFAQVASVVDHSALIVARPIEWCVRRWTVLFQ
jgi:hypothetical protein